MKQKPCAPSIEVLRGLLDYDRETGIFRWKRKVSWRVGEGMIAGCLHRPTGYWLIRVHYRNLRANRVAWALTEGVWPENDIDHIDGDPGNNKRNNLQDITKSQNLMKSKFHKNNTSGVRGVYWAARQRRWQAQINAGGVRVHLGYFVDLADAKAARAEAEKVHFGKFRPAGS